MIDPKRFAADTAGWVEPIYLDTSALVKLFVQEESSGAPLRVQAACVRRVADFQQISA